MGLKSGGTDSGGEKLAPLDTKRKQEQVFSGDVWGTASAPAENGFSVIINSVSADRL